MSDLVLVCYGCKFPVGDGDGWLRVLYSDIREYTQRERAWNERAKGHALSVENFLLGPDLVHWRAYHRQCDPDMSEDSYWISSERIRTWPQLVRWTAQLMEKNWFGSTDWSSLLMDAVGDAERALVIRQVATA